MLKAYKEFWKRYIDLQGKSNRLEFWTPVLIHIIGLFIIAVIGIFSFIAGSFIIGVILSALVGMFVIAILVPMFAVTLRRFYDAGRKRISAVILIVTSILVDIGFDISQINGITITLNIISVICTLILIVIALLPSRHVSDEQLKWL
ncbi:DUF805 domain-containing protein [Staphylococcus casei]|uniref:DUF805 domain-containing protein n=1 Tax=Staphylococcus casei TaxID=201828 RepID=A0ABZ2W8Y5_9STAP